MERNSPRPSVLRNPHTDEIWLHIAGQLGFKVIRSASAYAATDGRGTMVIGTDETLDDDDCVAQLVLHELCHALVEGESKLCQIDWGLDNTSETDVAREYAALRLQAYLSDVDGLRTFMPPTTQWRPYYDALPSDALDGDDEAAYVVRGVLRTELSVRWLPHLSDALKRTAAHLHGDLRMLP